jgi:hypothetical protein
VLNHRPLPFPFLYSLSFNKKENLPHFPTETHGKPVNIGPFSVGQFFGRVSDPLRGAKSAPLDRKTAKNGPFSQKSVGQWGKFDPF